MGAQLDTVVDPKNILDRLLPVQEIAPVDAGRVRDAVCLHLKFIRTKQQVVAGKVRIWHNMLV